MRQRLGLAQALLGEPRLLLLDEPTVGLDPLATVELYQLLDRLRGQGTGIVLCSHALPGVETHIDRAASFSPAAACKWPAASPNCAARRLCRPACAWPARITRSGSNAGTGSSWRRGDWTTSASRYCWTMPSATACWKRCWPRASSTWRSCRRRWRTPIATTSPAPAGATPCP
ncbi:hypothetical protein P4114_17245 [Pseudomonas aeruginosa]|nr:hypothetical protein [Pseudomonas aeruginosa]